VEDARAYKLLTGQHGSDETKLSLSGMKACSTGAGNNS
jgi:hypothetical protein